MQNDILFDNIYIGHSVEEAAKLAAETFHVKHPIEKAQLDAEKPKDDLKKESPLDLNFLDDPVKYIREKVELFFTIAQQDPIGAFKFVPEVGAGLVASILAFLGVTIAVLAGGSPPTPAGKKPAGDAKDKAKDKAGQATASGADKSKAEATKRTTRSQS